LSDPALVDRAKVAAIIVAAGRGRRFGAGANKVFLPALGRPLLWWTLRAFERCDAIDEVVLVVGAEEVDAATEIVSRAGFAKAQAICPGGADRGDSVRAGLARLSSSTEIVAVHDGARPLVTPDLISACVAAAAVNGAAIPAVPVTDTLKRAGADDRIAATVDRSELRAAQTPQTFRRSLLALAHERAATEAFAGTDDASLVERIGHPVYAVAGDPDNLKVTVAADLERVTAILERRHPAGETRVGFGYDVHRLVPDRALWLGGVQIPHSHGLDGHSDADVLLHAICDALLGAAGLADIGAHFPNTDPRWAGVASLQFLRDAVALLAEQGCEARQVDATLLAEAPKIRSHVPAMKAAISEALGCPEERIGIKATTSEGLGFVGRQEGMAAWAVATVVQREIDR
jgi:2-C-methyl-D-erythritol 4-phosphate cytidylyltransferase/2-C-methyl-D-erythritol 2,4-cyclodiphosphate synthase